MVGHGRAPGPTKSQPHALMATSISPTCGHSNSPRQDGSDYGFSGPSVLTAMHAAAAFLEMASVAVHDQRVDGQGGVCSPSSTGLFGQAKRVRP